jgi:tetratricopeptide (TPR) repeat protein
VRRLLSLAALLAALALLAPPAASADPRQEALLDQGLRSDEPYSVSLWERSLSASGAEKRKLLDEALAYSPDLPGLYFKRAWAALPDPLAAVHYVAEGAKAYSRNFWWSHGLEGLLAVSVLFSLLASLLIAAVALLFRDAPLLYHEIREAKAWVFVAAVPLALSPLGPIGLAAGLLMVSGLFLRKGQKAVVYFSIAAVFLTPFATRAANYYLSSSTPALRAIVSVAEGKDNRLALEALKGDRSFEARFSYATALKRTGRHAEAAAIFEGLKGSEDHRVYTDLGNAYYAMGDRGKAVENYRRAVELGGSVIALYNLSQALRDEFKYSEGDAAYEKALDLDRDRVSGFTAIATKNPNRFVIDRSLGKGDFEAHAWKSARAVVGLSPFSAPFYFGGAAFAFALFLVIDNLSRDEAFRCSNCSRVVCPRCSASKNLCPDCLAAERRPDDTSPKAKVAKMLSSMGHKRRLQNRLRALSFTLPGLAHIYGGKPVAGLLMLWPFLFMATAMALNPLTRTGMAGFTHGWLYAPMALGCALVYLQSIMSVSRRLDRGWL